MPYSRPHWGEGDLPGLIVLAKLRGVSEIANSYVKIDDPVKSSAGANPLIHGLADSFAILAEVVRSFIGSQGCSEDFDVVLVRSIAVQTATADQLIAGMRQIICTPCAHPLPAILVS